MRSSSPEDSAAALCLTPEHEAYPAALRDLRRPPQTLWARGALVVAERPAVAIVGTRKATPYGTRVATAIATACARAGVCVVSGLAHGIDGVAHRAALAAQGRTVAVLGTGIDVYYPRAHRTLQDRIGTEGLLLSELGPGERGHAGSFPERNRIIAALADVTVVVEAGEESGALITAKYANQLGRTVASVPNAIDQPTARGSNSLIKRHEAEPILDPADVLALLDMRASPVMGPTLDGDAARCWDALQHGADDVVRIAAHTQLPARQVTALLALLEIDGLVQFDAAGRVRPLVGGP